jgi:hypothetical protein
MFERSANDINESRKEIKKKGQREHGRMKKNRSRKLSKEEIGRNRETTRKLFPWFMTYLGL